MGEREVSEFKLLPGEIAWKGGADGTYIHEVLVPYVLEKAGDADAAIVRTFIENGTPDVRQARGWYVLPRARRGSDAYQAWAALRTVTAAVERFEGGFVYQDPNVSPDQKLRASALEGLANQLAAYADLRGVPAAGMRPVHQFASELLSKVDELARSNPSDPNSNLSGRLAAIDESIGVVFQHLAPVAAVSSWRRIDIVHAGEEDKRRRAAFDAALLSASEHANEMKRKLDATAQEAARVAAEAQQVLTDAKTAVTAEVIARSQETYAQAAKDHGKSANLWLGGALGGAVALLILLVVGAWMGPPAGEPLQVVLSAMSRIAIVSAVATVSFWSARNYAVDRHNRILNVQRKNALTTFTQMVATASPQERPVILAALTQCLFGMQPTSPNARATDPGIAGLGEFVGALAKRGGP